MIKSSTVTLLSDTNDNQVSFTETEIENQIISNINKLMFSNQKYYLFSEIDAIVRTKLSEDLDFQIFFQNLQKDMVIDDQNDMFETEQIQKKYLIRKINEINLFNILNFAFDNIRKIINKINLDYFPFIHNIQNFINMEIKIQQKPQDEDLLEELKTSLLTSNKLLKTFSLFDSFESILLLVFLLF